MTDYTLAPQGKQAEVRGSADVEGVDASGYRLRRLMPHTALVEVNLTTPADSDTVLSQNDTINITVPWACQVIDMWSVAGATEAGCTVQVLDGSSAITDAITCDGAGETVRAGQLDPAYATLAKGGTLQVLVAGADAPADSKVFILLEILS